jgi:hypothetical protein
MKKITLLILLFISVGFVGNAQISSGSTFIGGSLGGSSSKSDNSSTVLEGSSSTWNLSIQLGKAIAINKIAGLYFHTGHATVESRDAFSKTDGKTHNYGGGLFYRQYFPLSAKWYLFGNGNLGFTSGSTTNFNNDVKITESRHRSAGIFISPGISFAAGKRLHIESSLSNLFGLGYGSVKNRSYDFSGNLTNNSTSKQLSVDANTSGFSDITFGLRWILPSKKQKS